MSKGAGVAIFGRLRGKPHARDGPRGLSPAACRSFDADPRSRSGRSARARVRLRVRYAGPICTLSMASCPSPNFP